MKTHTLEAGQFIESINPRKERNTTIMINRFTYLLRSCFQTLKGTPTPAQFAAFSFNVVAGLPFSVCVVDCAINDFIGDQISLSKGDALGF